MVQLSLQKQQTKSETCNATESLNLMKNLMSTSISCITYLRNLFEEDNYEDLQQNGLMLKTIKRSVTNEADHILNWLEIGCFDALEKKYLRKMMFGIYLDPLNPDAMEEVYEFRVTYPDNGSASVSLTKDDVEVMTAQSKKEIKKATQSMMRTLVTLTQTLKTLPDHRQITMRLYYYEDVTPITYEPPFFRAHEDTDVMFDGPPVKVTVGRVMTPYHGMDIKIHTPQTNFADESAEITEVPAAGATAKAKDKDAVPMETSQAPTSPVSSLNPLLNAAAIAEKPAAPAAKPARAPKQPKPAASQPKPAASQPKPAASQPKPAASQPKPAASQTKPAASQTKPAASQTKPAASQPKPAAPEPAPAPVVNCICSAVVSPKLLPTKADAIATVTCSVCARTQHACCYGFRQGDVPASTIKCYYCTSHTDPDDAVPAEIEELALMRLVLHLAMQADDLPQSKALQEGLGFPATSARHRALCQNVCNRLFAEGYLLLNGSWHGLGRRPRNAFDFARGKDASRRLSALYNRALPEPAPAKPAEPSASPSAMDAAPAATPPAPAPAPAPSAQKRKVSPMESDEQLVPSSQAPMQGTASKPAPVPAPVRPAAVAEDAAPRPDDLNTLLSSQDGLNGGGSERKRRKVSVVAKPLSLVS